MNSSTSSSKKRPARRQTLAIALTLLACFGVAEIGARKYARRRQNDLSDPTEFTSIGARAADLMTKPGRKIVFVGNSATEQGLDLPLFEQVVAAKTAKTAFHTTMCTATDSGVKDWNWMLEQSYWRPHRQPDLYVVTWFSANLQDTPVVERGRLAQFFTGPRDWPEAFQTDLPTLGDRSEFLFSYASILYARRSVTQEKLLRACAPGYEKFAIQLNATVGKQEEASEQRERERALRSEGAAPATYHALARLLKRARETNSRLCFVAYPRRDARYAYEISPQALAMIRQAGMTFLDLRQVPGLSPDQYRDSVHVNAQGRKRWTRLLAQQLAPLARSS